MAIYAGDKKVNFRFQLDVREHGQGGRLSEWVPYVQAARDCVEQNMEAFRVDGQLYFRIIRDIPENSELLIWYSPKFAIQLGVPELKEEYQKGNSKNHFNTVTLVTNH